MSDVLTRPDDFCSASEPPLRWSTWERRSQKSLKQRPLELPGEFSKPTSPVSPYPASNAPPEGMPHSSPAVLTDKFIWERLQQFEQALAEAIELSETMVCEAEASPIDEQTFNYAASVLTPLFIEAEMPLPLVLRLQNGGIGAEWHDFGMNIELRFRNPYHVYAVIEDAREAIPQFKGRDPYLTRARMALREFATRARLQRRKVA